jgi:hypothetical protein
MSERIILRITIRAPDQVHAFQELWKSPQAEGMELIDIHQDAAGLVHTFTLAEPVIEPVDDHVLECGLKELPPPVGRSQAVRISADTPPPTGKEADDV